MLRKISTLCEKKTEVDHLHLSHVSLTLIYTIWIYEKFMNFAIEIINCVDMYLLK